MTGWKINLCLACSKYVPKILENLWPQWQTKTGGSCYYAVFATAYVRNRFYGEVKRFNALTNAYLYV